MSVRTKINEEEHVANNISTCLTTGGGCRLVQGRNTIFLNSSSVWNACFFVRKDETNYSDSNTNKTNKNS